MDTSAIITFSIIAVIAIPWAFWQLRKNNRAAKAELVGEIDTGQADLHVMNEAFVEAGGDGPTARKIYVRKRLAQLKAERNQKTDADIQNFINNVFIGGLILLLLTGVIGIIYKSLT